MDWQPGYPGKGVLLHDGSVVTWLFNGDPFDAMHYEVMAQRGVPADLIEATFEIDVDGTVTVLNGELNHDDFYALQDAGLQPQAVEEWHMGAYGDPQWSLDDEGVAQYNDFEPWEPGEWGKAILYVNQYEGWPELETWRVDTIGVEDDPGYHHSDMVERVGAKNVLAEFEIDPNGELMGYGGGDEAVQQAIKLDPRLKAERVNQWNL